MSVCVGVCDCRCVLVCGCVQMCVGGVRVTGCVYVWCV